MDGLGGWLGFSMLRMLFFGIMCIFMCVVIGGSCFLLCCFCLLRVCMILICCVGLWG